MRTFLSFLFGASALASQSFGAVANLALDEADGSNLWPEQVLSTITIFSATNQPTTQVGATFNDGYFVANVAGAGSGNYRTLFRLQGPNKSNEQGYNRITNGITGQTNDFTETSLGPSSSPYIRKSDLVTTDDGEYYIFSFDANEGGSPPKLISLDQLRIYTRNSPLNPGDDPDTIAQQDDPSPLPTTFDTLGQLGDLRYDMNAGGQSNTIVIEAGGSGASDMVFFVPTANFDDDDESDLVYLYADHGNFAPDGSSFEFTSTSGFEEWSIPLDAANRPTFKPTPEPGAFIFSLFGLSLTMLRRKRA